MLEILPVHLELTDPKTICLQAEILIDGHSSGKLWFKTEGKYKTWITSSPHPFLVALTPLASVLGKNICVRGTVGSSLIRNLEEYCKVWAFWHPDRFNVISIDADEQREPALPELSSAGAIQCFSGGVDAAYTFIQLHAGKEVGIRVKACLALHGFDSPLDQPSSFEMDLENIRKMLAKTGIPVVRMQTNLAHLIAGNFGVEFDDIIGSSFAACLTVFENEFDYGVLASDSNSYEMRHFGTNPFTDGLLSSRGFTILNHGGAKSRLGKIEDVALNPSLYNHLRVCNVRHGAHLFCPENELNISTSSPSLAYNHLNCGRCEKCIRSLLLFRILGLPTPSSFHSDLNAEAIAALKINARVQLDQMYEVLAEANSRGAAQDPIFQILARRLTQLESKPSRLAQLLSKIQCQLAIRTRVKKMMAKIGIIDAASERS